MDVLCLSAGLGWHRTERDVLMQGPGCAGEVAMTSCSKRASLVSDKGQLRSCLFKKNYYVKIVVKIDIKCVYF